MGQELETVTATNARHPLVILWRSFRGPLMVLCYPLTILWPSTVLQLYLSYTRAYLTILAVLTCPARLDNKPHEHHCVSLGLQRASAVPWSCPQSTTSVVLPIANASVLTPHSIIEYRPLPSLRPVTRNNNSRRCRFPQAHETALVPAAEEGWTCVLHHRQSTRHPFLRSHQYQVGASPLREDIIIIYITIIPFRRRRRIRDIRGIQE